MKLSDDKIKEIADLLDGGVICYVHKETHEIKEMIDPDYMDATDPELWEDDLAELENNADKYVKLEPMFPPEAFKVMRDFAYQVSDEGLQNRLINALDKRQPFRNFRNVVDYREDTRQQWFKFKAARYQKQVRDYLSLVDSEDGLED